MAFLDNPIQLILGAVLILSSLGVVLSPKPVNASLSFLLTLLTLATIYLQLSAQFISAMQVLVYAGAILVIFMYVIVLFQDAHKQIDRFKPKSLPLLLIVAGVAFVLSLIVVGKNLLGLAAAATTLPEGYGTVQSLGMALYVDFFFPFEAVVLLFLISLVGALYIGKKG